MFEDRKREVGPLYNFLNLLRHPPHYGVKLPQYLNIRIISIDLLILAIKALTEPLSIHNNLPIDLHPLQSLKVPIYHLNPILNRPMELL